VFRIFEDRSEQPVVQFACEDAPLSVGIVFDSSGSMQGKLAKSREALV
jgi:Ca-activated chloride channel family protein